MSVCLFCGCVKVKPGKRFCSKECWRGFEHLEKSYNCMGVSRSSRKQVSKRNLGEVIDEINDEYRIDPKAVEPVIWNDSITNATHQLLEEVLQGYKKYRMENGLF